MPIGTWLLHLFLVRIWAHFWAEFSAPCGLGFNFLGSMWALIFHVLGLNLDHEICVVLCLFFFTILGLFFHNKHIDFHWSLSIFNGSMPPWMPSNPFGGWGIALVLRNMLKGTKGLYLNNWLTSEKGSIIFPYTNTCVSMQDEEGLAYQILLTSINEINYVIYFASQSFLWTTLFSITSCLSRSGFLQNAQQPTYTEYKILNVSLKLEKNSENCQ